MGGTRNDGMQVLRHMCEGLVALLMDRPDYHKFMMRSVARDLLASLVFRPIMQHMTPYNINKVHSSLQAACMLLGSLSRCCIVSFGLSSLLTHDEALPCEGLHVAFVALSACITACQMLLATSTGGQNSWLLHDSFALSLLL